MDIGDYYWGFYRDYFRDPFPIFPTKHQTVSEVAEVGTGEDTRDAKGLELFGAIVRLC